MSNTLPILFIFKYHIYCIVIELINYYYFSNLIVPNDDIPDKTQVLEEKVSIINGVLNPTKFETVKQIEDELLKLLDTPFIQNVSHLPSITNRLAVPKVFYYNFFITQKL